MLLQQATVRNVSRALREINAFDWEGDFKPMARQALKRIVEKGMEEEMTEFVGLRPYERAPLRTDYRNGYYVRHLLTEIGDLELLIPRSRRGGFKPKLLTRYARRHRSIDEVLLACFCLGLSTRKAACVLVPMVGEKVSASTISRIAQGLDEEVALYHSRALKDHYRFLFFDGVVLRSKGALRVQKKILLCAFGITVDGRQEIIDFHPSPSESQACWEAFLNELYRFQLCFGQSQDYLSDLLPKRFGQRIGPHKGFHLSKRSYTFAHRSVPPRPGFSREPACFLDTERIRLFNFPQQAGRCLRIVSKLFGVLRCGEEGLA